MAQPPHVLFALWPARGASISCRISVVPESGKLLGMRGFGQFFGLATSCVGGGRNRVRNSISGQIASFKALLSCSSR